MKQSGLALVEVAVAAAVSSAVVAMFFPVYAAARKGAAHPASNVRRVALASLVYAE